MSVEIQEVEGLMSELSSKGLMLITDAPTENEALELVKNTKQWTHG